MRPRPLPLLQALSSLGLLLALGVCLAARGRQPVRTITWEDVAPLRALLEPRGTTPDSFASYVERVRADNARRVRDGDLDHLVFYLLQSTRFTSLAPIEPALSAKSYVATLSGAEREAFLQNKQANAPRVPAAVRSRINALLRALDSPTAADPRLTYFRALVQAALPGGREREAALTREYLRVMRFVYEKEFVAQRAGPAAVAELYRDRGLSTDTAVESGYVVHLGLGVVRALNPDLRIRRVLIVGPGLDLAPRTALQETGPPQSYQPWAVLDALLALGVARAGEIEVVAADINPRVVDHLRQTDAPTLNLMSEIRDSETVTLTPEYRSYFTNLGQAIADGGTEAADITTVDGHLRKTVRVPASAVRALKAEKLDIVTERLDGASSGFDLVIATNILPYFDDVELMLAMSNVAGMLVPGGVFLHNEARPFMHDVTTALGLPFEQSRHVIIANVKGATPPLFDSVFLHRKKAP
jgi:hypothetical protein